MKLDAIVNRTPSTKEYLLILPFLGKNESYSDLFEEGKAKIGKAAVMLLTSADAVSKFPGVDLAGSWTDEPISIEPFNQYIFTTYTDVTVDVFTALYKNGYREALMSMVNQLSDPSNENVSKIVKFMREGRYREANSHIEKMWWDPSVSFYIEFGKAMEAMSRESHDTEGTR